MLFPFAFLWYKSHAAKGNLVCSLGFPGASEVKASACNLGSVLGSVPVSGRSPGEGNGNPLQYSCLENPMEGGAWWATVHGVTKSQTRLSDFTLPTDGISYSMETLFITPLRLFIAVPLIETLPNIFLQSWSFSPCVAGRGTLFSAQKWALV